MSLDLARLKERQLEEKLRVDPNKRIQSIGNFFALNWWYSSEWNMARLVNKRGYSISLTDQCHKRINKVEVDAEGQENQLKESRRRFLDYAGGPKSTEDGKSAKASKFSFGFVKKLGPNVLNDPYFQREVINAMQRKDCDFFQRLGTALRDYDETKIVINFTSKYREHMFLLENWLNYDFPKSLPLFLCSHVVIYDLFNLLTESKPKLSYRDKSIEVFRRGTMTHVLDLPKLRKPPIRSMSERGKKLIFG